MVKRPNNCALYLRNLPEYKGDVRLYRMLPPIRYEDLETGEQAQSEYAAVSAVVNGDDKLRTFILPATREGKVLEASELEGTVEGVDHEQVLKNAGYWTDDIPF